MRESFIYPIFVPNVTRLGHTFHLGAFSFWSSPNTCNLLVLPPLVSHLHDGSPLRSFLSPFLTSHPQGCSHHCSPGVYPRLDFQGWPWVMRTCCTSSPGVLPTIRVQSVTVRARSFSRLACLFPTCQALCCEWDVDFRESDGRVMWAHHWDAVWHDQL